MVTARCCYKYIEAERFVTELPIFTKILCSMPGSRCEEMTSGIWPRFAWRLSHVRKETFPLPENLVSPLLSFFLWCWCGFLFYSWFALDLSVHLFFFNRVRKICDKSRFPADVLVWIASNSSTLHPRCISEVWLIVRVMFSLSVCRLFFGKKPRIILVN